MTRRTWILLGCLGLSLVALANRGALQAWAHGLTYAHTGKPAPELPRLRTLDGRTIQLADLRGRVVLLHFWTFG